MKTQGLSAFLLFSTNVTGTYRIPLGGTHVSIAFRLFYCFLRVHVVKRFAHEFDVSQSPFGFSIVFYRFAAGRLGRRGAVCLNRLSAFLLFSTRPNMRCKQRSMQCKSLNRLSAFLLFSTVFAELVWENSHGESQSPFGFSIVFYFKKRDGTVVKYNHNSLNRLSAFLLFSTSSQYWMSLLV